jgi:hypothetical protein
LSGTQLNLSKKQIKNLSEIKEASQLEILNADFSIKTKPTLRQPIGFVTRGDFSQLEGKACGICIVDSSLIGDSFYLFRKPTSLTYHLCRLINL